MTAAADLSLTEQALTGQALETLKQAGNPFRNYFARNPDDEVCARYHVADLFSRERSQLLGVVDLYRQTPETPSEMVPILGNKGAGKTHLLHSLKHGREGDWQLLVTPGTYQKETGFMEYLLFQFIDTLLSGGKQKGRRPLEFVSEELGRRLLLTALTTATPDQQLALFPAASLGWLTRKLGLGTGQAQERTQWLIDRLSRPGQFQAGFAQLRRLCAESQVDGERAWELVCKHIDQTEEHGTAGLMRRQLRQGFARAALLGDESELANFLTYGFAELDVKVQPSRQDLVLALFKVLMEVFQSLRVPVVVAFDQLEDLLLARRSDDGHRTAEAFFAGIVHAMHQISGVCFLVFAERGLWNRFVPSLDGYIQDRLNNPVHLPGHGTIKALRLEAPPVDLVRQVVQARLRGLVDTLADKDHITDVFPFTLEQVEQVARTEPTLRDMLQQFRHLFDHLVYGESQKTTYDEAPAVLARISPAPANEAGRFVYDRADTSGAKVKSVMVVETPADQGEGLSGTQLGEVWDQAMAEADANLAPEGSVTGATRELQAGLGSFLRICHEHGVKVGPWRLQHVVPEWTFGEHPTYGVISIAHWVCKDGQPWKVGIGLFLGRGAGKPKDLEIKLASLEATPPMIDHLILLRPDDDLALTGKSKTIWQEAEKRGRHARLEPVCNEHFAILYGFPRWLTALSEGLPAGQPLPNCAVFLQERCEKLLEQVCMPCP